MSVSYQLFHGPALLLSAVSLITPSLVTAQSLDSKLDASLRFGLELQTEPDTILNLRNFGSRIRWAGASEINSSTDAIGYLEFRLDDDLGIDDTHEAWAGLDTSAGKFTAGTQFAAFYDFVSSKTDIANWNSCIYQIACAPDDSLVKYTSTFSDSITLAATANFVGADGGDADNSFVDVLEGGGNFKLGALSVGTAFGFVAKEGNAKAGFAFGLGGSFDLDRFSVAADVQYADKNLNARLNNIATNKAQIVFTVAARFANAYGLISTVSNENKPFTLTGGYTFNISKNAYFYAEASVEDPDLANQETSLSGRGVFVYTFDGIRVTAN